MSTNPQPEALRLADELEFFWGPYSGPEEPHELNAAAELRRLHSMNQELLDVLKLCRPYMYDYASNTSDCAFDKLCTVIAKATGETK